MSLNWILASQSPRRKEIFRFFDHPFTIEAPEGDEVLNEDLLPAENAQELAANKALQVSKRHPQALCFGFDTLVHKDQRIFGKPATPKVAEEYLHLLSGSIHQVFTGVAIATNGEVLQKAVECTHVEFRKLSNQEIMRYIATNEPLDKAGAYGIQGFGAVLVKQIYGCYYNVVGLPVHLTHQIINRLLEQHYAK
jgi:septum formation protein